MTCSAAAPRWLAVLLTIGLAFGLPACDDDDGNDGASYDHYVNMMSGSDLNPGTKDMPFASITKALSVVEAGQSVKVWPGTYTAANGETFPLRVPADVQLVGNSSASGDDTVIDGGGASPVPSFITDPFVTMIVSANVTVTGFTVLNGANGHRIGIQLDGDGIYLHRNTVRDIQRSSPSTVGIAIVTTSGAEMRLEYNVVTGNGRGIALFLGGDRTKLEGNRVVGNGDGVTTANRPYYYDFGGGTLDSAGGNVFSCNEDHDVAIWYGNTVDMKGNQWDHVPPEVSQIGGDIRSIIDDDPFDPEPDPVYDASEAELADDACI